MNMLNIGLKLSLSVKKKESNIIMTLVGWEEGNYIIAKNPSLRTLKANSKDECVIRFVKDGTAYGFHTSIISLQFSPSPLVFFRYPKDIKSMPFRKTARLKTNLPAKIMEQRGEREFITIDARILDLSLHGCLIEVPSVLFMQTEGFRKTYLTFMILDKTLEVECSTKNYRKSGETYLIGAEFIEPSTANQETISSFISMFQENDE